jgi:glucose/arabinose dehydrogenase
MRPLQASLLLIVAACGASGPTSAQSGNELTPSASTGGRPFTVSPIATFDSPWAMAFLPGGTTALITEKPGRIWLIDVASGAKQQVAGAPSVVVTSQGGLLDIAVSPHFANDGLVYLSYSRPTPDGGSGLALARARLVRGSSAARLNGLQVIWRDRAGGQGGQFGARIAFAPDGNSLFLSSGERQRFTPAQDPSQPLGKILHLTLDGKPAADNPMTGRTGSTTVEITDPPRDTEAAKNTPARKFSWPGPNLTPAETWTTGHRNPLGLAFAPDGRLWSNEMGPRGGDEVNLIERGKNYGWPDASNGSNYDGVPIPDHRPGDGFEPPKVWWNPSISPAGLIIYTGDKFPEWQGDALMGALSGEALIRVDIDGDNAKKADEWGMGARIREVEQGPGGEVYLLEDGRSPGQGRLLRLDPAR